MTLTVAQREEFLRVSRQNEKLDSVICFRHPGPSPRVPSLPVPMAEVNYQGPQPPHRKAHRAPCSKNLKHRHHKTLIPQAQTAKNNCAMAFLEPALREQKQKCEWNAQRKLRPRFTEVKNKLLVGNAPIQREPRTLDCHPRDFNPRNVDRAWSMSIRSSRESQWPSEARALIAAKASFTRT